MKEKEIENLILDYLTAAKGMIAWQNKSTGIYDSKIGTYRRPGKHFKKGVPDIIGFLPGSMRTDPRNGVFFIEVKTATGTLSEAQKEFRDDCKRNNIPWFLARSLDDVKKIF